MKVLPPDQRNVEPGEKVASPPSTMRPPLRLTVVPPMKLAVPMLRSVPPATLIWTWLVATALPV